MSNIHLFQHKNVSSFNAENNLSFARNTGLKLADPTSTWSFPSDHVPIAIELFSTRICTWNVLNSKWLFYFESDKNGLADSNLLLDNYSFIHGLTKREYNTIMTAIELLDKCDLLLLQECSLKFIDQIKTNLPNNYQILRGGPNFAENDIVAIYNDEKLTYLDQQSEIKHQGYISNPTRAIMKLAFQNSAGANFDVINSHVPGDPKQPGLSEFAAFIAEQIKANKLTLIAGDLNFEIERIAEAFSEIGIKQALCYPCFNTCIGTNSVVKGIDHLILLNAINESFCKMIPPVELSTQIATAVDFLNPQFKHKM